MEHRVECSIQRNDHHPISCRDRSRAGGVAQVAAFRVSSKPTMPASKEELFREKAGGRERIRRVEKERSVWPVCTEDFLDAAVLPGQADAPSRKLLP